MNEVNHRGWHNRGYLPHLDAGEAWQFITFRLADSLPRGVVESWKAELEEDGNRDRKLLEKVDDYLDRGHGSCVLKRPEISEYVENSFRHFDGDRYELSAWVVMPNHVHVLVKTTIEFPVGKVVGSWKMHTTRQINARLGEHGRLWQPDYFDRFIRNEQHFLRVVNYIEGNPVSAGLVGAPEDWRFSSACARKNGTP